MSTAARSWRPRALAGALLVTLALSLAALNWPAGESPATLPAPSAPGGQQRAAPAQIAAADPASSGRIELERFGQRDRAPASAATVQDAFAVAVWDEAPAAPARPARPAPARVEEPTAPPLPFRFLGRYDDGAAAAVVLLMGDRVYIASPGHVIDNTWRLERLGRRELELTYLPLQLRQTMRTGE